MAFSNTGRNQQPSASLHRRLSYDAPGHGYPWNMAEAPESAKLAVENTLIETGHMSRQAYELEELINEFQCTSLHHRRRGSLKQFCEQAVAKAGSAAQILKRETRRTLKNINRASKLTVL